MKKEIWVSYREGAGGINWSDVNTMLVLSIILRYFDVLFLLEVLI